MYSGASANIHHVAKEMLDIVDLETSTPESRRSDRLAFEEAKFDQEHYMADLMDDEEIQHIISAKTNFRTALKWTQSNGEGLHPFLEWTAVEKDLMASLHNRNYLVDAETQKTLYLGLVDVLFAYCYNVRTTEGEDTVESPWTICKLSGTLSSFDAFHNLQDAIQCCIRRSLAYPLYRHFQLTVQVFKDVTVILKLGKRAVLKALLHIKRLLERDEVMFVLDRLWIADYCVWIQQASDKHIRSLASQLHHIQLDKSMSQWPLDELEAMQ